MDDCLRIFKPEGEEYHYKFCIFCDKPSDDTMLLTEFGICRDCCKELLSKVPPRFYPYVGRILIFASRKEIIV